MAVNIGPKIGIDGEAEYRKAISDIINHTKTLSSEMKTLESSFNSETKSLKENAAQRKLLNEQIETQKERVKLLSDQLESAKTKWGENATQTEKWKQAVNNATTELNELQSKLKEIPSQIELVGTKFSALGDKISSVGDKVSSVGTTLTTKVTAPIAAGFTATIKSAVDWESAFTGVMKTVDETATTSYSDIADAIMEMSTETASSKEEIAAVAEAAGQLGVVADDIEGFTKTMVMLGDTTNLSADEAATAIARFTNITGSGNGNVDRLGSAIVALGNNFATTESDIVEMSTRLASAGTIAGLSETDILALSTAMSSVGIQAEAGGTAMTQTLTAINTAVMNFADGATEDLDVIASVAGVSAQTFAETWESNPVAALQTFIEGLGNVKEEGGNVAAALDEMGMSGIRQSNMLQSLALASDMLGSAVATSSQAYEENTALIDEATLRYGTMESQFSQLKESVTNLAISFGEQLMPYVQKGVDFVQNLVDKFSELDESEKQQIIQIAAVAAAVGPILLVGGKIITAIGSIISAGGSIISFAPKIVTAFSAVGTFLTGTLVPAIGSLITAVAPVLASAAPFIAVGAAIVGAGVLIYKNWDTIKEKAQELLTGLSEAWTNIKTATSEAWTNVSTTITTTASNIKASVAEKWEGIKQSFITVGSAIKTVTATDLANIKNAYDTNGGGIKGIVAATWEGIKSYYTLGFDVINTLTNGKLDGIKEKFTTIFENVKESVGDAMSNVVTSVKDKFGEIIDFISDLPSRFYSWGSEMIGNLASGISNGIDAVSDAISSVAETISSYIHFSEPDVGPLHTFNSWMPDMMSQMATQIEAGRAKVQSAINNVASDISMTGTSNTVNYGGTNINIYASEGMDVNALADEVEDRINNKILEMEATFA